MLGVFVQSCDNQKEDRNSAGRKQEIKDGDSNKRMRETDVQLISSALKIGRSTAEVVTR